MIRARLGDAATGWFTTRSGGSSRGVYASLNLGAGVRDDPEVVSANRDTLAAALGRPVAFLTQVHSTGVLEVGRPMPPGATTAGEADAALTASTAVGLGVLVADCVPVLLAGDGVVAAVHAGRRGLLAGVVRAALAAMARRGAPARFASIGPAICGACYEVPEEMRAEAVRRLPALGSRTSWGTPALDLAAGVRAQLEAAGVPNVEHHELCTREDSRFYSYRRDGVTGRCAGVVARAG